MKNKPLSKLDILGLKSAKVVEKELSSGQTVCYKELSASSVMGFNEKIETLKKENPEISSKNSFNLSLLLLTMTVCDKDGNLLFTEEDIPELANQSMNVLTEMITHAMSSSGISQDAIAEAKDKLKNAQTDSLQ